QALRETGAWTKANPAAAARVLGPLWGNLDSATVQQANGRRSYDVQPVQLGNLGEQQRIADAFYREGLLPKPVDARAVTVFEPQAAD
ncbi:MAG: ABC transporter substrate-binding protein, partial [Pseudomonas putida]